MKSTGGLAPRKQCNNNASRKSKPTYNGKVKGKFKYKKVTCPHYNRSFVRVRQYEKLQDCLPGMIKQCICSNKHCRASKLDFITINRGYSSKKMVGFLLIENLLRMLFVQVVEKRRRCLISLLIYVNTSMNS